MTEPRGEPTEFAPAPIRRGRRGDVAATALVALVVLGLAVAIVKPWQGQGTASPSSGTASGASPSPRASSARDAESLAPGATLAAPTWAGVGPVLSGHDVWGVRAITADRGYRELWQAAARTSSDEPATVVVAPGAAAVIALGVTFPTAEAPLDLRAWLDHGASGLEWLDAQPLNQLPGEGGYLLVRPGPDSTVQPWAPGRYRLDVLVGHGIRRLEIEIRDATGVTPAAQPWSEPVLGVGQVPASDLTSLAVGAFAWDGATARGAATATAPTVEAGPALDEVGAWLDVDRTGIGGPPRSFVGRIWMPGVAALGVVLPPSAEVASAAIHVLAPSSGRAPDEPADTMTLDGPTSYVAFSRSSGAAWRPGVYALDVAWRDAAGVHDATWYLELLPGPARPEPWLLAATRAWAPFAGQTGVLLGTTDASPGGTTTEVTLLPISPATGSAYPGLTGLRLLGCGETLVRGYPSVVGFVASSGTPVTPVQVAIQYPFYAVGAQAILGSTGAVPGLTVVTPAPTGAFDGPAAYGFRVGPSVDSPTYTVCIDMQPPG